MSGANGLPGNADLNRGDKPPTSILPTKTTAGVISVTPGMGAGTNILSGALTATVYKELVSLATSGILRLCGVKVADTTSRTIGLKVVIDGVTVFDETSPAITLNNSGILAVGHTTGGGGGNSTVFESFKFNKTLSLQIKSSLTETDKVTLAYLTAVT